MISCNVNVFFLQIKICTTIKNLQNKTQCHISLCYLCHTKTYSIIALANVIYFISQTLNRLLYIYNFKLILLHLWRQWNPEHCKYTNSVFKPQVPPVTRLNICKHFLQLGVVILNYFSHTCMNKQNIAFRRSCYLTNPQVAPQ